MAPSTVPSPVERASMSRQPIALHGAIGERAAPVEGTVTAVSPSDFFGEGHLVEIDDVSVVQVRLAPARYEAAEGMPDLVDVVFLVSGELVLVGPRGSRAVAPGALVFSRPTRGDVVEIPVPSVLRRATMPASVLPVDLLRAEGLATVAVRPEHASAFAAVLDGIVGLGRISRPSTSRALRDAVVETAGAILIESMGGRARDRSAPLAERARHHIDAVFRDPRTTPVSVAASLGVSVRALHQAFEREELSVARCIRQRRLTEVERALTSGRTESVSSLARRSGFSSAQRLTRAYRAVNGRSIGGAAAEQGPTEGRVTAGTDGCSAGTPRA